MKCTHNVVWDAIGAAAGSGGASGEAKARIADELRAGFAGLSLRIADVAVLQAICMHVRMYVYLTCACMCISRGHEFVLCVACDNPWKKHMNAAETTENFWVVRPQRISEEKATILLGVREDNG